MKTVKKCLNNLEFDQETQAKKNFTQSDYRPGVASLQEKRQNHGRLCGSRSV